MMEASRDNLGDAISVDIGPFFRKVFKFSCQRRTFNSSLKFYGGFDAKYLINNFQDQVGYEAVTFVSGNPALDRMFVIGDIYYDPVRKISMSFLCMLVDKIDNENVTFVFINDIDTMHSTCKNSTTDTIVPDIYFSVAFDDIRTFFEEFSKSLSISPEDTANARFSSLKVLVYHKFQLNIIF
jgi:hypothetical protein